MFLEFITLLILVVVMVLVSYVLLRRQVTNTYDEVALMIKETNVVASKTHNAIERIFDHQNTLDEKMDALGEFVDRHSTNVAFQNEQFNALAKADMLAARREELLRTKELKVALERLMGVAFTSKQPPAPNDVVAIENLTKRIAELETILN